MITILDSIVNIIGGRHAWPFNEHTNIFFDNNGQHIHTSSKNNEESNYGLNLDMVSILYKSEFLFHVLEQVG